MQQNFKIGGPGQMSLAQASQMPAPAMSPQAAAQLILSHGGGPQSGALPTAPTPAPLQGPVAPPVLANPPAPYQPSATPNQAQVDLLRAAIAAHLQAPGQYINSGQPPFTPPTSANTPIVAPPTNPAQAALYPHLVAAFQQQQQDATNPDGSTYSGYSQPGVPDVTPAQPSALVPAAPVVTSGQGMGAGPASLQATTQYTSGGPTLAGTANAVANEATALPGQAKDVAVAAPGAIKDAATSANQAVNTYASGQAILGDVKAGVSAAPDIGASVYGAVPQVAKDTAAIGLGMTPYGIANRVKAIADDPGQAAKDILWNDPKQYVSDFKQAIMYGTPEAAQQIMSHAMTVPVLKQALTVANKPFQIVSSNVGDAGYNLATGKDGGFWDNLAGGYANETHANYKSWMTDPANKAAIIEAHDKGTVTSADGTVTDLGMKGGDAVFALYFAATHPANGNLFNFVSALIDGMGFDPLTLTTVLGGVGKGLVEQAGVNADAARIGRTVETTDLVDTGAGAVKTVSPNANITVIDGVAHPKLVDVPDLTGTQNVTAEQIGAQQQAININKAAQYDADVYNGKITAPPVGGATSANPELGGTTVMDASAAAGAKDATPPIVEPPTNAMAELRARAAAAAKTAGDPAAVQAAIDTALQDPRVIRAMTGVGNVLQGPEALNNLVVGLPGEIIRRVWNSLPEEMRTQIRRPFNLTGHAQVEKTMEGAVTGADAYAAAAQAAAPISTDYPANPYKTLPTGDLVDTGGNFAPNPTPALPEGPNYIVHPDGSVTTAANPVDTLSSGNPVVNAGQGTLDANAAVAAADIGPVANKADSVQIRKSNAGGKPTTIVGDGEIKVTRSADGVFSIQEKKVSAGGAVRWGPATDPNGALVTGQSFRVKYDPMNETQVVRSARELYADKYMGDLTIAQESAANPPSAVLDQPKTTPLSVDRPIEPVNAPPVQQPGESRFAFLKRLDEYNNAQDVAKPIIPAAPVARADGLTQTTLPEPTPAPAPANAAQTKITVQTNFQDEAGNKYRMMPQGDGAFAVDRQAADGSWAPVDLGAKTNLTDKQAVAKAAVNAPEPPPRTDLGSTERPTTAAAPTPNSNPERNARLQAGTQSVFEPVQGGNRLVDQASANATFEQLNSPRRATAFTADREIQARADAARQDAVRLQAERDALQGPARNAMSARIDDAWHRYNVAVNDAKINAVETTVDTAGHHVTATGNYQEPVVNDRLRANLGDPNRPAELYPKGQTPAGNNIGLAKEGSATEPRVYTIDGKRGVEGNKNVRNTAYVTKRGDNSFDVAYPRGKVIAQGVTEQDAIHAADAALPTAQASLFSPKEKTPYLMERAVYQQDKAALQALQARVSTGALKPGELTPQQFERIQTAFDQHAAIRDPGNVAKASETLGSLSPRSSDASGIVPPDMARLMNEGYFKPGTRLAEGAKKMFTPPTTEASRDPFIHFTPEMKADYFKLSEGPRYLVDIGKMNLEDASAVSQSFFVDGHSTTIANMYDDLIAQNVDPRVARDQVLNAFRDHLKATQGFDSKELAYLQTVDPKLREKIVNKLATGKNLTADERAAVPGLNINQRTRMRAKIDAGIRRWDNGQSAIREGVQYNMVTGVRGGIQDTIFDWVTSLLSGHGGAYGRLAKDAEDVGTLTRAISTNNPELLNQMNAWNPLYEGGVGTPHEYNTLNKTYNEDFSGRTETQISQPTMALERHLNENWGVPAPVAKYGTRLFASKFIKTLRNSLDATKKIAMYADQYIKDLPAAQKRFDLALEERAAKLGKDADAWRTAIQDEAKATAAERNKTWTGNFSSNDVLNATGDTSLARTWASEQLGLRQAAKAEADRVLYSYRKTNIDQALSHTVFFHYWATRSLALHADIALHNPMLLANYIRGFHELEREAKGHGFPSTYKYFLHFMGNTAGGMYGMIDPVAYIVPMGMLSNMGNDNQPLWKRAGIFLSPWTEAALGAFGIGTSIPNITGALSVETMARHVLDYAKAQDWNIPGLDNKELTPSYLAQLTSWAEREGNAALQRFGYDKTANPFNTMASPVVGLRSLVHHYAEADFGPEFKGDGSIAWTPEQVALVADADFRVGFDGNHAEDNPYSNKAYDTYTKGQMGAALASFAIPVVERVGPLDQMKAQANAGYAATGAGGTATPQQVNAQQTSNLIQTGSEPAYKLNIEQNAVSNAGPEQGRLLVKGYNDIVYGTNGVTANPADHAARVATAEKWLNQYGAGGRLLYQQALDAKGATIAGNPDAKAYHDWTSAIGQMDPTMFQVYVKQHPAYEAYLNGLPASTKSDPAKLDGAKFSQKGYLAVIGEKATVYDQPPGTPALDPLGTLLTGGAGGGAAYTKKTPQEQLTSDIVKYNTDVVMFNQALKSVTGNPNASWDYLNPMLKSSYGATLQGLGINPPSLPASVQRYQTWANVQQSQGKPTSIPDYIAWLTQMQATLSGSGLDPNTVIDAALSGQYPATGGTTDTSQLTGAAP